MTIARYEIDGRAYVHQGNLGDIVILADVENGAPFTLPDADGVPRLPRAVQIDALHRADRMTAVPAEPRRRRH